MAVSETSGFETCRASLGETLDQGGKERREGKGAGGQAVWSAAERGGESNAGVRRDGKCTEAGTFRV